MIRVLIIEDNDSIRENIIEVLTLSGYEVDTAINGKIGIDKALKNKPDIILCDIMMPELDGYGVLYILNKNPETQTIPFIFLTAKADKSDIRKGMELGADDYLTKPFDDAELLRAIECRIKKRDAQQLYYGHTAESLNSLISNKNGLTELKEKMLERSSREYKTNQYIHYEGDRVTGIYYIISGKVKTVKHTKEGRELITGIYREGEYLDLNIISIDCYSDTAIALEATTLSFLPIEQLDRLLFLHPDIGAKFIKILTRNIREKEQRLLQIAYMSVRKRIAEAIIKMAEQNDNGDNSVKITRDNLAALSGTSPETVSRTLSDFKAEGLIEKNAGALLIINFDKLNTLKN
ncbi:response regulator [Flavobacterium alkalisoli]|uniref:Response regulator n=1 Tax=Flavobacterium alkalisoli TaxID=2602769 RepID=A0A5B9FVQ1_9FLAO|nr:response regulator [Flavobacterium alkalisoli]QEE49818.1 response regulator [Flavobacterium alkalisoli]